MSVLRPGRPGPPPPQRLSFPPALFQSFLSRAAASLLSPTLLWRKDLRREARCGAKSPEPGAWLGTATNLSGPTGKTGLLSKRWVSMLTSEEWEGRPGCSLKATTVQMSRDCGPHRSRLRGPWGRKALDDVSPAGSCESLGGYAT